MTQNDVPEDGPDLSPPGEGFELYRHRNAGRTTTRRWHGYYWARPNGDGDYEIRSLPTSLGEPSMPGGIMPKDGFEAHYERAELP
jgi:hypothetical protein